MRKTDHLHDGAEFYAVHFNGLPYAAFSGANQAIAFERDGRRRQQECRGSRLDGGKLTALAIGIAIAALCLSALLALRMWLRHREKELVHLPVVQLEAKLLDLEQRLMAGAMRR